MTQKIEISSIWEVEQEILDVFHEVCEKNHLKYTLAYGTLIGAIRHKGFIPWDDDIDVMMPRKDYEKLIEIWNKEAPVEYLIQEYKKDFDYTNNFAKVRKNHTTFLQFDYERTKKYHKGIFIDIFPGDLVPNGRIARLVQYVACAINLLFSRGFRSGNGGMIGFIEKVLLCLPRKFHPTYRNWTEQVIRKWNDTSSDKMIFPSTIGECKRYFPAEMFDLLVKTEFEGKSYYVVKDYDQILRLSYGDYMKLPPEEERIWAHHPLIVDFKHNYEELG